MLDVRLPAQPRAAYEARESLRELADRVTSLVFEDLRLLVSELVTNSLRHARLAAEDIIRLRAAVDGSTVRVEVCDEGPGFAPPDRSPTLFQQSGWGLFLVKQIADRWGVRRNGATCVWFEIDLTAR